MREAVSQFCEMERRPAELRCIANLPECVREACRWWSGTACTWQPPERERRTRGARLMLGKVGA
jgi:hypothetical protein